MSSSAGEATDGEDLASAAPNPGIPDRAASGSPWIWAPPHEQKSVRPWKRRSRAERWTTSTGPLRDAADEAPARRPSPGAKLKTRRCRRLMVGPAPSFNGYASPNRWRRVAGRPQNPGSRYAARNLSDPDGDDHQDHSSGHGKAGAATRRVGLCLHARRGSGRPRCSADWWPAPA